MAIDSKGLDHVFHALADPTRRGMLALLARGEHTAGQLGEPFRISQPSASKHLRVLERSGLVKRRTLGRHHCFKLRPDPLRRAERWIAEHRQLWEHSFDRLDSVLAALQKEEPS